MKALRNLIDCKISKITKIKQTNGTYIEEYILVDNYKVIKQELIDIVSSNVYGANINKTYRISSPYNKLEKYLATKLTDEEDNISKYTIEIDNKKFKVVAVKNKWVDIELL